MNVIDELINNLKSNYHMLKDDFNNQNHDLHFLKEFAKDLLFATSNFKMNETISFSDQQQGELVKLLAKIRKLIRAIEKEIEIQTKEEYFNSNNTEI